jgi:hypothetical protein
MKFMVAVVAFALVAGVALGQSKFSEQLTEEQRKTLGVDRMTGEQRAMLDALAERYAEQFSQHAVVRVRDRVRAEVQAETKVRNQQNAGLATRGEDEAFSTRIAGDFRGWDKNTIFRLQNGQVWQVDGSTDNRFFPKRVDPEVELRPAGAFGGWKLYIQPEGLWVRVKRVR